MKRRFIVSLNEISDTQRNAIVNYMKSNKFGWWHWLENFWLVVDTKKILSSSKLRNDLNEIAPGVRKLVIEFTGSPHNWAGVGPHSENRDMFKWLHETWGTD